MEREGKRRRNEVIAPSVLQEDKTMKLENSLLPGISDEVTLELIATKLPWRTFHTLSSVGPAWRQAVQNRLVSDARVRAHSEDSFVIISDTMSSRYRARPTANFLYSLRTKTHSRLPPIPQVKSGFPYDSECIALDGKVYILGGSEHCSDRLEQLGSKNVYVLDLAGQRQWKPCARMREARANFTCGAKHGKFYVFGGTCGGKWVLGSEVYDPSVNSWSAITPMGSWPSEIDVNVDRRSWRTIRGCNLNNAVATGGEELLVVGGDFRLRIYHPVTDKWRTLPEYLPEILPENSSGMCFIVQGKLHSFSPEKIYVYDLGKNEWIERHSWSVASTPHRNLWLISALAVDNEIIAMMRRMGRKSLVRSNGFGSDDKEIVWEEFTSSFPLGSNNASMCLLKL